ncbi:hypothetical protein ABZY58_11945 [Micromonospora tulbaghiae]|uniref:hypothetical protein n=1 Tax=Micromonospora tulbaghiae TaxID=479978 RepID=UPI0033A47CC3
MTPGDAARLLGTCALYDYREPSKADAVAWFAVIGDLEYDEAAEAVRRHYRDSTERIMPAHIRRIVREIRDERRRVERKPEVLELPSRFEDNDDAVERSVRIERGLDKAQGVLGPVLAALAAKSPPPSSLSELRALTPGPADLLVGEEEQP